MGSTAPLSADLRRLESQSIHILREVVAECRAPVLLYSIGKDSSVLLHLAGKAFAPGPIPFPLLHIDTGWKFRDMIAFRDATAARLGLRLIVHSNAAARAEGINPFDHGASFYTHAMKTLALREALDAHGFDAAFGGARRDEDPARSKERIVSPRTARHEWDPRSQRPEFWSLYNCRTAPGSSLRIFPLSDWTEMDVWRYIAAEQIAVVPLYFAAARPTVQRDGALIVVDDDRMRLAPGEAPVPRMVRFRSLGCWPLTGATLSDAADLPALLAELAIDRRSERHTRLIDRDPADSMEQKKREGYF
jgi:sulfate adenylyltransferase subunit 2